ncbi:MAG: YkgJ family cysteine cluster protein [Spirochaetales bacterium]
MNEVFYSEGLHFHCKQCSHCCRHEPGYVYLSQTDLSNLCVCLDMNAEDFIQAYCRIVPYYNGTDVLALQEKPNYDCIFWDKTCTVYNVRPVQCITYPFWSFVLKDNESWQQESKHCPGINCGTLFTKEKIQDALHRYTANVPITMPADLLGGFTT